MITYMIIGLVLAFASSVALIVYHLVWGIEYYDNFEAYGLSAALFASVICLWPLMLVIVAIVATAKYIASRIKRASQ